MRKVIAAVLLTGAMLVACTLYVSEDAVRIRPDGGPVPGDGHHGNRDAGLQDGNTPDDGPLPPDDGPLPPDDGPLPPQDGGAPGDGPRPPHDGGAPGDGPRPPHDGRVPGDGPR